MTLLESVPLTLSSFYSIWFYLTLFDSIWFCFALFNSVLLGLTWIVCVWLFNLLDFSCSILFSFVDYALVSLCRIFFMVVNLELSRRRFQIGFWTNVWLGSLILLKNGSVLATNIWISTFKWIGKKYLRSLSNAL